MWRRTSKKYFIWKLCSLAFHWYTVEWLLCTMCVMTVKNMQRGCKRGAEYQRVNKKVKVRIFFVSKGMPATARPASARDTRHTYVRRHRIAYIMTHHCIAKLYILTSRLNRWLNGKTIDIAAFNVLLWDSPALLAFSFWFYRQEWRPSASPCLDCL